MECQIQKIADVVLMQVAGRIDHKTAKAFEEALLPQLDSCTGETKKVLLDLGGVHYMSSAGLRVLMLAAKQCRQQEGEIVLATLQPLLREVFNISRFNTVFQIFDSIQEGLEALSPAAAAVYGRS